MDGGLSKKEQEEINACRREWVRANQALKECDSPENVRALDEADRKLDAKLLEVYCGKEEGHGPV